MNICVDVRSPFGGGISTYAKYLLMYLLQIDSRNRYLIIHDSEKKKHSGAQVREIVAPSRKLHQRLIWDHTFLPALLKKEQIDVYHSLKHISSFKSDTKLIYTVHSAGLYKYPNFMSKFSLKYYYLTNKLMTKTADAIIAVSQTDKKHFADWMKINGDHIEVTHLASDISEGLPVGETNGGDVLATYNLPENYILYVGIPHPIKNVVVLLEAYSKLNDVLQKKYKLVIVGKPNRDHYFHTLEQKIEELGIKEAVLFPGYIHKEYLTFIYSNASLFIFPSYYESFALPILEAISCGCPVLASNTGAIPELYGDSIYLADPYDSSSFAGKMSEILSSDTRRKDLIRKGLSKSKDFSWKQCAEETLQIYQKVLCC